MERYEELKARAQELARREWDMESIVARYLRMAEAGMPQKTLNQDEMLANKEQILDLVQQRAEEYNYLTRNCAKGTAQALLEEFGLGNLEIVQALSPFPGFGGTGWMCGAVTGGLIALGLYFGSRDVLNYEATGAAIQAAREFMSRFKAATGSVLCPELQKMIFGRYMDPAASPEHMAAFAAAKGFEKCSLLPGIGARIAAGVIIEGIKAAV
jgi:Putative redox-active protein (C_GCAxxG_C_C).